MMRVQIRTHAPDLRAARTGRRAFTLTELLVVIAILLILAGMTLAVFNTVTSSDRIRSGARQLQSALLGAKDRALFAQKVSAAQGDSLSRGIRLITEPGPTGTRPIVRQMVYIQETEPVRFACTLASAIQLRRIDTDDDVDSDSNPYEGGEVIRVIREVPSDGTTTGLGANPPAPSFSEFQRLKDEGLLKEGTQVYLVAGTNPDATGGDYYTIQFNNPFPSAPNGGTTRTDELYLVNDYTPNALTPNTLLAADRHEIAMRIELPPQPIVGEQPLQLPAGIVIDIGVDSLLSRSDLPQSGWTADYAAYDILFNARGGVGGRLGATGLVPFLLCDGRDVEEGLNPASPTSRGDWLAVTLFTQTGFVISSAVDATDARNNTTGAAGADGLADDPYRFAKMGEAASR
jgi:prepilin-type N-terminal cleavage/methylation domain-containing protein